MRDDSLDVRSRIFHSPLLHRLRQDIASDERFLFLPAPALQLPLARHRLFDRGELLGINDPDRSPGSGIACAVSFIVGVFARGEIVGVADV